MSAIRLGTVTSRVREITGLDAVNPRREGIHIRPEGLDRVRVSANFDSHRRNREIIAALAVYLPQSYAIVEQDEFAIVVGRLTD